MSATFSVLPPLAALLWRCFPPCRRAYFLLLCQKKVAKEKAPPRSASGDARSLPLLGSAGVLPKLACGSNKASRLPPHRLRCSAPSKGTRKASRHDDRRPQKVRCCGALTKKAKNQAVPCQNPVGVNSPRGRCRATQVLAEKGRGLSEAHRAEFRSPRQRRVAQGTGRSPAPTPGRLLFAYFFLAKQEKVMSRVRRENPRPLRSQKA